MTDKHETYADKVERMANRPDESKRGTRCPHGILWPHPCRECEEDAERIMAHQRYIDEQEPQQFETGTRDQVIIQALLSALWRKRDILTDEDEYPQEDFERRHTEALVRDFQKLLKEYNETVY